MNPDGFDNASLGLTLGCFSASFHFTFSFDTNHSGTGAVSTDFIRIISVFLRFSNAMLFCTQSRAVPERTRVCVYVRIIVFGSISLRTVGLKREMFVI